MRSNTFSSIAFSFLLALLVLHAQAATIIKGPYLQTVTKTSVVVSWQTDVATTGTVDIGTDDSYGTVVADTDSKEFHEVLVDGLSAETVYHYRVTADDAVTTDAAFQTAVNSGTPFKFTFYGDSQDLNAYHQQIVAISDSINPDFYIILGDLVANEVGGEWQTFFDNERIQLRDTPFLPVKGNHDGAGDTMRVYWQQLRENLTYSYDYGNVHIANITRHRAGIPDTGSGYSDYAELNNWLLDSTRVWLEADLAAASTNPEIDWIFVLRHQPYIKNDVFQSWDPLFDQYGVDFVLTGDAHLYSRSVPLTDEQPDFQGTVHIVSGTASKLHPGSGTDSLFADTIYDKNNGVNAEDAVEHHCGYFEVNGKDIVFKDFIAPDGALFDSCRVVKDNDGNVILRENSVVQPGTTPVAPHTGRNSSRQVSLRAPVGTGTVVLETARSGSLTLDIYDMTGRRVSSLRRPDVRAGRHTIGLPGSAATTPGIGLYLVRVRHGQEAASAPLAAF